MTTGVRGFWVVFWVLLVLPRVVSAQSNADVIGLMRQDGIALPHFEWRGGAWAAIKWDSLPSVSALVLRDSTGRADRFPIVDTVSVVDGYDARGWQTGMPKTDDPTLYWSYPVARAGYVVSRTAADAPFLARQVRENESLRAKILRAVEVATDSILPPVALEAWEATLGATKVVFFEFGSGPGVVGCYGTITTGWYRDEWDAAVVATHQRGADCEKVEHRRPWALVERGGGLYGHVTISGWESAEYELWSLENGASLATLVP